MRDLWAAVGTLLFLIIAPGAVFYFAPFLITGFELKTPFAGYDPIRPVGGVLIAAGLWPLLDSFARFAIEGRGTPAPIAPTEKLIASGFYRHVRNPMYAGGILALIGETLLLGDWRLAPYAAAVWLLSHFFVIGYEEPTLARTYGPAYEAFAKAVPRWLPRLSPWRPDAPSQMGGPQMGGPQA